ncbi:FHA domain-containing protein [Mycobacterium sp. NPDC051804]|uniref:FHA domain-containing protein n=1 Tax=Mycobacterium sp. NPDC051804 TaxID=3364295 RepID=UPI003798644B
MTNPMGGPPLTVTLGSAVYTFPADRDVTVGRSVDSDIHLDGPGLGLVSRTHVLLRVDQGRWFAIDKSQNGIFVDGKRVEMVDIRDGAHITIGDPGGPRLVFRVSTAHPPRRSLASRAPTAMAAPPSLRPPPRRPPPRRPPPVASAARPPTGIARNLLPQRPPPMPPGATSIGRGPQNEIVVDDALVSRVHAILVPTSSGLEIRDNRSGNGTFVNGRLVTQTLLRSGDVVTVGNSDFTVAGDRLEPRSAAVDAATGGLEAYGLGFVIDGRNLLTDISFTARPGTVTAVIGPSGAGKSTLIRLLGGATQPSFGWVSFDGSDVHGEYASLRSRIGIVPQDDVVHRQLTVEQALDYAAELRLPPDTTAADRRAVVARVLDELELTAHRATRVDKLSGGQRKRASVAMELLTGPSLLILDEPTSGLDPSLDRQVMTMLRQLADAGRVVIVVTHSLAYLKLCDQVLLLASGGRTAFVGSPAEVWQAMNSDDWADIFAWVSTDPEGAHQAFLARHNISEPPAQPSATSTGPPGEPTQTSLWRQISTVARRQVRLTVADRGYFIFLAALPFVVGVLALVVPGNVGFGPADPAGKTPNEPTQLLILINISAVFMGTALTIRDLVGERAIFRREQAVGLSASAYLAAKIIVFSVAAAIQAAILTTIVVIGKDGPTQGSVLLGNASIELYLTLAGTAVVSAIAGLALSSLARSPEQILPMVVVVIMMSMVFCNGLIQINGRLVLDQISWLLPGRWGFAASASTVDLMTVSPLLPIEDTLWTHKGGWWLFDMAMLVVLAAAFTILVRYRLRLPTHDQRRTSRK